jgi:hypothetical protein
VKERTSTESDTSDLGKVLRTSRKLAAAKNFLAVDLSDASAGVIR